MEGTLFGSVGRRADGTKALSAWPLLAEALGPHVIKADFAYYQKWLRGEYPNFVPWMEDTSTLFKTHGLTRAVFDAVIQSIEYFFGVKEVCDALHSNNVRTAVITGGFYEQAERASRDLGIHHIRASCRFFWDEKDALSHWELEEHGLEGKVDAAKSIAAQHNVSLEECCFVGDGANDVHIARAVGTSIAFNGEDALRAVTTHMISQPEDALDFRAVLEYLLPYVRSGRIAS